MKIAEKIGMKLGDLSEKNGQKLEEFWEPKSPRFENYEPIL